MNHKKGFLMRSASKEIYFNSDIWLTTLCTGGALEGLIEKF